MINKSKYQQIKNIQEGEDVTLPCTTIKGRPTPNVTWYDEHNKVLSSGAGNARLHVKSLQRGDDSNYTCVASSIAGTDRYTVFVGVQCKSLDLT